MVEDLGTGVIPGELYAILVARFRSGRGIHSFLVQLALGVDHIPVPERLNLVGVNPDEMLHLFQLLFSVLVDIYSTRQCLFACRGELTAEGLPPVVDIPNESFTDRRYVCAVPRVDHLTCLGGIYLTAFQKILSNGEGEAAGS